MHNLGIFHSLSTNLSTFYLYTHFNDFLNYIFNIDTFKASLELEDYNAWKEYVESSDASSWQPVKPILDGDWFLVSIFCNEDGAFATWAKEKAA